MFVLIDARYAGVDFVPQVSVFLAADELNSQSAMRLNPQGADGSHVPAGSHEGTGCKSPHSGLELLFSVPR